MPTGEGLAAVCAAGSVEDIAPGTCREVEICHVLAQSSRLHGELESTSKHDVVLLTECGSDIVWELKEERLVKGSTLQAQLSHLSIIVSDEEVLVLHCHPDDVEVSHRALVYVIGENVWLLWVVIPPVVVSGEWIERPNNIPSCTQLWSCIIKEATDIRAGERNPHHIVGHDAGDRVTHVGWIGEVVSQPSGCELTHSSVGAPFDDHGPAPSILEPFMSSLRLLCSKQGMGIKLGDSVGVDPI